MTLRKWSYLFWTTLFIGTVAGMAVGAAVKWTVKDFVFMGIAVGWYEWIFMLFGVSMISVLSQMGFFAYLTLRFIVLSVLRGKALYWDILQVVAVIIALFDLVYLRYTSFAAAGESWLPYTGLPLLILIVSLLVAYRKMQETNRSGFVPTLFFMTVVTILEAVPALKLNQPGYTLIMVIPLLVCNAWQIMQLHKLLQKK